MGILPNFHSPSSFHTCYQASTLMVVLGLLELEKLQASCLACWNGIIKQSLYIFLPARIIYIEGFQSGPLQTRGQQLLSTHWKGLCHTRGWGKLQMTSIFCRITDTPYI